MYFMMINTSDIQTPSEIEAASIATASTITDSRSNTTTIVPTSIEGKKRKINAIYSSGRWMDEDPYEIMKVRQVIRNHVFKNLKFVKGEG